MPKMKCAKCSGSGRAWKKFFFFRWRSTCAYCNGSGQINMFEPPPKPARRNFGLREFAPKHDLPDFLIRSSVPIGKPLTSPTDRALSEATEARIMDGLASALQVPADSGTKQPGEHRSV